jgi:hypothetical protein
MLGMEWGVPRDVPYLSAKSKSFSSFGWLFVPNVLLDINRGLGQAALYHQPTATDGLCVSPCFAMPRSIIHNSILAYTVF